MKVENFELGILCMNCFKTIPANPLSTEVVTCPHCGHRDTHQFKAENRASMLINPNDIGKFCTICGKEKNHSNHKKEK